MRKMMIRSKYWEKKRKNFLKKVCQNRTKLRNSKKMRKQRKK